MTSGNMYPRPQQPNQAGLPPHIEGPQPTVPSSPPTLEVVHPSHGAQEESLAPPADVGRPYFLTASADHTVPPRRPQSLGKQRNEPQQQPETHHEPAQSPEHSAGGQVSYFYDQTPGRETSAESTPAADVSSQEAAGSADEAASYDAPEASTQPEAQADQSADEETIIVGGMTVVMSGNSGVVIGNNNTASMTFNYGSSREGAPGSEDDEPVGFYPTRTTRSWTVGPDDFDKLPADQTPDERTNPQPLREQRDDALPGPVDTHANTPEAASGPRDAGAPDTPPRASGERVSRYVKGQARPFGDMPGIRDAVPYPVPTSKRSMSGLLNGESVTPDVPYVRLKNPTREVNLTLLHDPHMVKDPRTGLYVPTSDSEVLLVRREGDVHWGGVAKEVDIEPVAYTDSEYFNPETFAALSGLAIQCTAEGLDRIDVFRHRGVIEDQRPTGNMKILPTLGMSVEYQPPVSGVNVSALAEHKWVPLGALRDEPNLAPQYRDFLRYALVAIERWVDPDTLK